MLVRCYRNLRNKCYSVQVKTPNGWRVKYHLKSFGIANATFKVSEVLRQKIIRQQQKEVHAFVVGELIKPKQVKEIAVSSANKISYNPYNAGYFYKVTDLSPIYSCPRVIFTPDGVYED